MRIGRDVHQSVTPAVHGAPEQIRGQRNGARRDERRGRKASGEPRLIGRHPSPAITARPGRERIERRDLPINGPARHQFRQSLFAISRRRRSADRRGPPGGAETTLTETEDVRDLGSARHQEEDGLVPRLELGCADHDVPVDADLATGHPERDGLTRTALQIRTGLHRDDGVDPAAVVGPLGARVHHAPVDDHLRTRDDLAEFRWEKNGRAKSGGATTSTARTARTMRMSSSLP